MAAAASIKFDEKNVLSPKQKQQVKAMNAIVNTANACIKSMKHQINKDKIVLLTGVAVILIPPQSTKLHLVLCDMIGTN
eukprot:313721-Ditylum_brightwellii.AAC.1